MYSLFCIGASYKYQEDVIMDKDIITFLIKAKRVTYAGKGSETKASRPNSHDFEYQDGDLRYIDTYIGGQKFA